MEGQRRSKAIRLQEEFYYTRTYDLLHHFDDSPLSVTQLKFYQWILQLQLQKTAGLKVSHRDNTSLPAA
jgi:hypothetical protein